MLIVSGGHTLLVVMEDHGRYRMMGQTVDDAAGEAFDKVARFLGLGYPGGPAIDRLAAEGDPDAVAFPRAMLDEGYDFSFSGLKTAVVNHVRKHSDVATRDVAASFQEAVVDVLTTKLVAAADEAECADAGARRRGRRQLAAAIAGGRGGGGLRAPGVPPAPGVVHRQRRHDRRRRLVADPGRRPDAARRRRRPLARPPDDLLGPHPPTSRVGIRRPALPAGAGCYLGSLALAPFEC